MTINVVTNSFSQNVVNGKCSNIFCILCSVKNGGKWKRWKMQVKRWKMVKKVKNGEKWWKRWKMHDRKVFTSAPTLWCQKGSRRRANYRTCTFCVFCILPPEVSCASYRLAYFYGTSALAQNLKCTHANVQEHSSTARFTNIVQKTVCTFVILWKNTKFQMLMHNN